MTVKGILEILKDCNPDIPVFLVVNEFKGIDNPVTVTNIKHISTDWINRVYIVPESILSLNS